MKVESIRVYNNLNKYNSYSRNHIIVENKFSSNLSNERNLHHVLYKPYIPSFGLKSAARFIATHVFNIPCPCCGRIMLPRVVLDNDLTEKVLSGSGKIAINALSKFEKSMHKIEKLCFRKLKAFSKLQPEKSLQEMLEVLRPKSIERLISSQLSILDIIVKQGEGLSPSSKEKLMEILERSRKVIIEDNPEGSFKRKKFIDNITRLIQNIPEEDKPLGESILNAAFKLSTSKDDLDAFIIKYSGFVSRIIEGEEVKIHRSSLEIGQRLVYPSVATFEHIKPKSNGGSSETANGLAECFKCNNTRGNIPFDDWIRLHPEMEINLRRYMDVIIRLIRKNPIMKKNYPEYPVIIAKTILEESKGLIDFEICQIVS